MKQKIIIKISGNLLFSEDGILNKKFLNLLWNEAIMYFNKVFIFYGGGNYIKKRVRQSCISDYLNEYDKNDIIPMLDNMIIQLTKWCEDKPLSTVNIDSLLYQQNDHLIITRDNIRFNNNTIFCNNILTNGKKYYFPSSDETAARLSEYINPDILLFLTEVDGIYYPFPYELKQLPLAEINAKNRKHIKFKTYTPGLSNMSQKVDWAMLASTFSIQTIIANGNNLDNINCIFTGRPYIGTKIKNEG